MGVGSLAERLVGGGRFAIITSSALDVLGLSGAAAGGSHDDDLPVLEIPLDVLLGDTAGLEEILEDPIIARAQFVLLLPPFGRSSGRPSRYDMPEIATRNVAAVLAADKRFGCVLLPRSISGRRFVPLLGEIVGGRYVSTVVEVPARELYEQVGPAMRVCVVVLEVAEPPRAVFISIPVSADVETVLEEYVTLVSDGGRTEHGFTLEEPIDCTLGILPSQVDPERARRIEETSIIGDLRRLGDICEIHIGPFSRRGEPDQGDVPLLTARSIRNGKIALDEPDRRIKSSAMPLLQAGDIVVSAWRRGSSIQAAEVYEDDLPMIADRSVLVLRTGPELRSAERRVLVHFITTSRRFSEQLVLPHQTVPRILPQDLADVRVPIPESDLLDAFQTVDSAVAEFEQWRDEAAALLESSLDADNLAEARHQLITSSNLLRQRAAAARLLDDLDHRVATRYPLPVAYRWRVAVAERDGPKALRSVLHAYEVLLAYLAIMALNSARAAEVKVGHVTNIRQQFTKGITLGNWKGILDEVAEAKDFRRLPVNHPFVEVRDFFRDPTVGRASSRLYNLRNDDSHLREVGPRDYDNAIKKAWSDLESLFLAAEFTTEYPLIRVLETRWDSFECRNNVAYRHLAGNQSIVPREVRAFESSTVETDSLYLIDSSDQLHLLRPYMIGMDCQECGHWSTLHPDRVLPEGDIAYKSFEHGHQNVRPRSVGRELAEVGLMELDSP